MTRRLSVVLAGFLVGTSALGQQPAPEKQDGPPAPLLQVQHLNGDQSSGFTKSCLLVYNDGRYHQEIRHQEHRDLHPNGAWQAPTASEDALSQDSVRELKRILENERFRALHGTLGDPDHLTSRLEVTRVGMTAHALVEIFQASIARADGVQVFEVFDPARTNDAPQELKDFFAWASAVEAKNRKGTGAVVNNCSGTPNRATDTDAGIRTRLDVSLVSSTDPNCTAGGKAATHDTGKILLRLLIGSDGQVDKAYVKRGVNTALDQCALAAVHDWRFTPARLFGMTISTFTDVEIKVP